MKLNLRNILYILTASLVTGLLMNFINPVGIPLLKETKKIAWADSLNINDEKQNIDTLQNRTTAISDSIETKKETLNNLQEKTIAAVEDKKGQKKKEEEPLNEPLAIKLEQAYRLYKQNVTFLDARYNDEYNEGHIKGALSLPYYEFDDYKNILSKIPKGDLIVTYCAGTDCDLSVMLGNQLFKLGYKNVYIFFGGWNDWTDAAYPVDSLKEITE